MVANQQCPHLIIPKRAKSWGPKKSLSIAKTRPQPSQMNFLNYFFGPPLHKTKGFSRNSPQSSPELRRKLGKRNSWKYLLWPQNSQLASDLVYKPHASPPSFVQKKKKNLRRLELSISKIRRTEGWDKVPGSADRIAFPGARNPRIFQLFAVRESFSQLSRKFPRIFLGNPRTDPAMGGWKKGGGRKTSRMTPPPKRGFGPSSYGAFSTPLRCQCSVFPVPKSTTEQNRSSFGGAQKFSGERVLRYVFLPPYVLHPPISRPNPEQIPETATAFSSFLNRGLLYEEFTMDRGPDWVYNPFFGES